MTTHTITFRDLVLKKNCYQCKTEENVIYDFFDAKVKNIVQTKNGFKLSILLNDNDLKYFDKLDSDILDFFKSKNKIWFENDLDEDEINSMYNHIFCNQNHTIDLEVSEKTVIKQNDKCVEMKDVYQEIKSNNTILNIKIQYIGFTIFQSLIENKILVKTININQIDDIVEEDRNTIENFWQNSINDCLNILNEDIVKITEKKKILQNLITELKNKESQDKNWEAKINEIRGFVQNIIFSR